MTTEIVGTGSYASERMVSSDDLVKVVKTNDEWIRSRIGIRERRIADCEGTSELAAEAAAAAMENAGIEASEIDTIVLATFSSGSCFPNGACEVRATIGVGNTVTFDISAAYTGFVYALSIMHAFLKSGLYQTGLVTDADMMSKLTDWMDRGTCVLFGDGAGTTAVRAEESGIVRMVIEADGKKSHVLICKARTSENLSTGKIPELGYTAMDGQEILELVVKKVPECVWQVLEESGMDIEEIKYSVMHQASHRIFESIVERLEVSVERIPMNMDWYGNTPGTSIPVMLDRLNWEGKLQPGDELILLGFGAGLTWGTALIEW